MSLDNKEIETYLQLVSPFTGMSAVFFRKEIVLLGSKINETRSVVICVCKPVE